MKRGIGAAVRCALLCAVVLAASAGPAFGDGPPPVNFIGTNFGPITTATSSNYDWATGTQTPSTATASVFSTSGLVESAVAAPDPPEPNGYGTFLGTARPVQSPTGRGAVLFEQSTCASFPLFTCLSDGTFTFGYMLMYSMRGSTLDELHNLQTQYYVRDGCFGGGSPRFSILMSNGSEIHVYLGTPPAFHDCPTPGMWFSTGQLASDAAGLRWDTSQLCPGTFYNTYSGAVLCANTLGLRISAILVSTDGGWNTGNQAFLFQQVQTNNVTRFP